MLKSNDLDLAITNCNILTSMIQDQVKFISDVLGMINAFHYNENDEIIDLAPYSHENMETLLANAKQLSSKSDRLVNKVTELSKLISSIPD